MRLIDRYLLREWWPWFAIALGVTTCVLFLDKLFWLTNLILRNRLDMVTAVRLIGYTLPTLSGVTLPIAFLIGCTLTFNRLSTEAEYIVFQAAGVSLYRLLIPFLVLAGLLYGISSMVLMYVAPWGFQGLHQLLFEVARSRVHYYLRAQEFHDMFAGLVIYVERTYPELQRLEGVFIADSRAALAQVITAQAGELSIQAEALQVRLQLGQGTIHRYDVTHKRYQLLRFEQYDIVLNLDTRLMNRSDDTRMRALFPAQLRAEIASRKALGKDYRPLMLFWHKLYALPFSCVIFAGLGPCLGIVHIRSRRSGGYIFGIGSIFLYYGFLMASDALGEETAIPPLLAAWLPNLCMGILTVFLLRRKAEGTLQVDMARLLTWLRELWQRRRPQAPAPR